MAVVAPRTTIEIESSICLYGKVSVTASTVSVLGEMAKRAKYIL